MSITRLLTAALLVGLMPAATLAPALATLPEQHPRSYSDVLAGTVGMVFDGGAQRLAQALGLNIVNVTWEDTGRYKGSSVGPNISDLTIQVQHTDPGTGKTQLYLMPVIRTPNFADVTADVPLDKIQLLVGNEKGGTLERVTLRQVLGDLRKYLHDGASWAGQRTSLLAPRDTHALVSAQAAFLPIPAGGEATFNPVLFNYQSYGGDPAVLTLLVTREGTSATIIDNTRDGFDAGGVWGQRLFFNADGQRASLTGKRESEVLAALDARAPQVTAAANGQSGMNMVMIIQVPLKQKAPIMRRGTAYALEGGTAPAAAAVSDVDNAVIGHGELEGPFTEIDGVAIERDERFPVRVTVQFYKATSNGAVNEGDMAAIKAQLDRVYANADYVGSLVTEGETGRPTEYDGDKVEPADWWSAFWQRYEQNMGFGYAAALQMMRELYNPFFVAIPRGTTVAPAP